VRLWTFVHPCHAEWFRFADAYKDLELDIADLFGAKASIFCSQESFARSLRFKQRGDIIVASRRIDIAIQKGLPNFAF
jgi:7-keto-8-aminopelargonate synthetase-like enzyme